MLPNLSARSKGNARGGGGPMIHQRRHTMKTAEDRAPFGYSCISTSPRDFLALIFRFRNACNGRSFFLQSSFKCELWDSLASKSRHAMRIPPSIGNLHRSSGNH